MTQHPTYLAAFRGGPHPMHPNSKAWHEQYVDLLNVRHHDFYRVSRLREGGAMVMSLVGSHFWYTPNDFAQVIKDARDVRFRVLASTLTQGR